MQTQLCKAEKGTGLQNVGSQTGEAGFARGPPCAGPCGLGARLDAAVWAGGSECKPCPAVSAADQVPLAARVSTRIWEECQEDYLSKVPSTGQVLDRWKHLLFHPFLPWLRFFTKSSLWFLGRPFLSQSSLQEADIKVQAEGSGYFPFYYMLLNLS